MEEEANKGLRHFWALSNVSIVAVRGSGHLKENERNVKEKTRSEYQF